jgi:uncharacterized membrane protein
VSREGDKTITLKDGLSCISHVSICNGFFIGQRHIKMPYRFTMIYPDTSTTECILLIIIKIALIATLFMIVKGSQDHSININGQMTVVN